MFGSAVIGSRIVRAGTGFPTDGNSEATAGTTGEVTGSAEIAASRGRGSGEPPRASSFRIGLISDTHGLLRPEAKAFLEGSDSIIHAGDIGSPNVLRELRALAPLYAVRGNNDIEAWAVRIPERRTLRLGGVRIHVLHDRAELAEQPVPKDCRVIIAGHSHKPLIEPCNGGLFVNPGSAGPRRFSLPVALGEIYIRGDRFQARILDLATGRALAELAVMRSCEMRHG
jgi:putative phosphoesterase